MSKILAQQEYKRRHDNIARNIHWELGGELDIDRANKWYQHQKQIESLEMRIVFVLFVNTEGVAHLKKTFAVVANIIT